MSLYQDLVDAGCEIDSHESDLYVRATPEAIALVEKSGYREIASGFIGTDGKMWIDVPFAYMPWWGRLLPRMRKQ